MKKKNILLIIFAFIICPVVLVMAGCKAKLESISVKAGTIKTEVIVNETLDTSNAIIIAKYSDGTTNEISSDKLTFSEIDTTQIGYQNLVVTYKEFTTTLKIKVVNSITDTYNIVGFEKPKFVIDYLNNIEEQPINKEAEFFNRTDGYFVGDDNPFIFLPQITALDENQNDITLNKYLSTSKVYLFENNAYTELTGDELTNFVSVDNENSTFDFTETAINKKFKISVRPLYLTDAQEANINNFTVNFEFTVVDGWNVYDVANLSRYDNNEGTKAYWAEYKAENHIGNEQINSMILHNDLEIKETDIPKHYIWQSNEIDNSQVVGKLKNTKSIYTRYIPENEKFTFIGNYFTIDAKKVPLVSLENPDATFDSHTMLFAVGGDNDGAPSGLMGECEIKNLSLIGNTKRSEDPKLCGGLITFSVGSKNFVFDNTITRGFFTNFVFIKAESNSLISNSKGYDSYSCMFYSHGVPNVKLQNGDYAGSGGPMIILAHVEPDKNPTSRISNMIVEDCTIDARVTGQEAWFTVVHPGADAIAAQIRAMNPLLANTSAAFKANGIFESSGKGNAKTFVKDDKINFVCAIMADDALANTTPIGGYFKMFKDGKLVGGLDLKDETLQNWVSTINSTSAGAGYQLPYFQSAAGGFSTISVNGEGMPNGLVKLTTTGLTALDASDVNLFDGNYLNIYANGGFLGAMVEYYNV